jgi:hypothetical protein
MHVVLHLRRIYAHKNTLLSSPVIVLRGYHFKLNTETFICRMETIGWCVDRTDGEGKKASHLRRAAGARTFTHLNIITPLSFSSQ